jgi:hypothetical protein
MAALSIRKSAMSVRRVAPRQRRTATSLRRLISRLRNSAVTFAQAINSTHADAPSSVYIVGATPLTSAPTNGRGSVVLAASMLAGWRSW